MLPLQDSPVLPPLQAPVPATGQAPAAPPAKP
jgi:hypothetical protein